MNQHTEQTSGKSRWLLIAYVATLLTVGWLWFTGFGISTFTVVVLAVISGIGIASVVLVITRGQAKDILLTTPLVLIYTIVLSAFLVAK